MIFTLLFLIWTLVLIAAWVGARLLAFGSFALAIVFSLALFLHHATDPLTLSF
jgi:hypothetical protein